MDAVKRAAGAVMNSPLFRKKFCSEPRVNEGKERGMCASKEPEIDPRRDLTPFVQGIYHSASFLGITVCSLNAHHMYHGLFVRMFMCSHNECFKHRLSILLSDL